MHRIAHVLLVVAALFTAACATDRQMIDQARGVHQELEPAIVKDAELKQYMEALGQRVIDVARVMSADGYGPDTHFEEDPAWMFSPDMEFHFVNSDTLNAFTTGEPMYVYTKLFQVCRSEDELAAVVAHEYGHVYAKHVKKGMQRQQWAMVGAGAGALAGYVLGDKDHKLESAGLGLIAASTAANFLNMGYTRDDEAEADKLGFDFYVRAGWDPAKFGDFFQQLIDQGHDTTPEMLSDHPSLKSRVAAAKQRAASLKPEAHSWRKPAVAADARFGALQQRSASLAKTMPSDKSLSAAQTLLSAVPSCLLPEDAPEQKRAQAQLAVIAQGRPSAAPQQSSPQKKKQR